MSRFPSIYRIAQVLLDVIVAVASILIAFGLRFEGQIPVEYGPFIIGLAIIAPICRLLVHGSFQVYRQIWRLFSLRDFWAILQSNTFYLLLLTSITRLVLPKLMSLPPLPLGVAVMDWGFCTAGMTLIRFLRTYQVKVSVPGRAVNPVSNKRILLLGAGRAGAQVVRESQQSPDSHWQIVGFLDDDTTKIQRQVEGVQVFGKVSQLVNWVYRLKVDVVLITMPSAPRDRLQEIVNLATAEGITIKILPRMQELLLDRSLAGQIRDVRLEDLLGRPEIVLDFAQTLSEDFPSTAEQIRDQVVLVTGAGGTIGSELCRQLARLQPRQLILLGRGENSIFYIERELKQTFPLLDSIPVIADVRHTLRVEKILQKFQPHVIFHAAAHKHVPLMEQNPTEAIENNTIASAKLALLADQVGVETFVLISTDKAVAPNNFMGLSKRLAELLISGVAQDSQTRFLSVRFGNVLGSRGSVVPIFQSQIAKGGPVTVTDPTMTRFFMTTPEAARLVLQSLAVGKTAQILVLDMGKPMRIYALAEQLIRLKGYVPGRDIDIQITGIRPGEKLHEALVDHDEELRPTAHPRLNCLGKKQLGYLPVASTLERIDQILQSSELRLLWNFLSAKNMAVENSDSALYFSNKTDDSEHQNNGFKS